MATGATTPPPRSRLVWYSAVVVAIAWAGTVAWFAAGRESLASPGPISQAHLEVATQCASCHEPWRGVADAGCALCHDPMGSDRFATTAHLASARSAPEAHRAALTADCATCHGEHQGLATSLVPADDAGCRTCHVETWSTHPQFAVFEPGAVPSGGIALSHAIHMPEVERTLGVSCEGCHRRAPEAAHFEPIEFDRDCASCHLKDGALTELEIETTRPHRDRDVLAALARSGRADAGAATRRRAALVRDLAAIDDALQVLRDLDAARIAPPSDSPLARRWAARGIPLLVPARSARDTARADALETARTEAARLLRDLDATMSMAPTGAAAAARRDAAEAEAAAEPCLMCHQREGYGFRPVSAARPILDAGAFTHAPHIAQSDVTCGTCHADIDRSGSAQDLNLPRVTTCQQCHGVRASAPVSCATCHTFHRSLPRLPLRQ
jgi:hypothetical protein